MDGDDRQTGPRQRLLAEPVLPLLTARGGVLNAHLGDGHLGHVDQGVHAQFPGDRRHGHGRLQIPGGHGQTKVDPPTAVDDPIDIGRFEQVSDHHLGASCPQIRRPFVLAADQCANRKPALKQEAGHGSPDRPDLAGRPGDKNRSVIDHATSLLSPNVEVERPGALQALVAGKRGWRARSAPTHGSGGAGVGLTAR
jgi:hypothetical protein